MGHSTGSCASNAPCDDFDGLIAIGLLFPAEIAGVLLGRGLSLREYLASFVTAPGIITLLMFLLFAAIPALVTLLTHDRVEVIP
jgi:hypothetical protein